MHIAKVEELVSQAKALRRAIKDGKAHAGVSDLHSISLHNIDNIKAILCICLSLFLLTSEYCLPHYVYFLTLSILIIGLPLLEYFVSLVLNLSLR